MNPQQGTGGDAVAMTNEHFGVPFFAPVVPRPLSETERAVIERLASDLGAKYKVQLPGLLVVGRCGCERCPTIFFQSHINGDREHNLASFTGQDLTGGLVAAVLLEKEGMLSQLEFYSIDGHDPWFIPEVKSLAPYQ
jgi:hypothetical protein